MVLSAVKTTHGGDSVPFPALLPRIRMAHVHILAFFRIIKRHPISSFHHTLCFWRVGACIDASDQLKLRKIHNLGVGTDRRRCPLVRSTHLLTIATRTAAEYVAEAEVDCPAFPRPLQIPLVVAQVFMSSHPGTEHEGTSVYFPQIDRGFLRRLCEEFSGLGTSPCPAG